MQSTDFNIFAKIITDMVKKMGLVDIWGDGITAMY